MRAATPPPAPKRRFGEPHRAEAAPEDPRRHPQKISLAGNNALIRDLAIQPDARYASSLLSLPVYRIQLGNVWIIRRIDSVSRMV